MKRRILTVFAVLALAAAASAQNIIYSNFSPAAGYGYTGGVSFFNLNNNEGPAVGLHGMYDYAADSIVVPFQVPNDYDYQLQTIEIVASAAIGSNPGFSIHAFVVRNPMSGPNAHYEGDVATDYTSTAVNAAPTLVSFNAAKSPQLTLTAGETYYLKLMVDTAPPKVYTYRGFEWYQSSTAQNVPGQNSGAQYTDYTGGNGDILGVPNAFWEHYNNPANPVFRIIGKPVPRAVRYGISLQSVWGFCSAENGGGQAVNCNRSSIGPWEKLILTDTQGPLKDGDKVYIEAPNMNYFSAQSGGPNTVTATRTVAGQSETFTIHKVGGTGAIQNGDSVSFLCGGNYMTPEAAGAVGPGSALGLLDCNRKTQGTWETFQISITKDVYYGVSLFTSVDSVQHGSGFCAAENAGGGAVNCNRNDSGFLPNGHQQMFGNGFIGPWEKLLLTDTQGTLKSGDKVYIQASGPNLNYFSAQNGGGSTVAANRLAAGPWETFTIMKRFGSAGPAIQSGDQVSFLCSDGSHYLRAGPVKGGLDCAVTSPGSWGTFNIFVSSLLPHDEPQGGFAPDPPLLSIR